MAKRLSVSVPEPLWAVIEASHPDLGPSEIVRLALERLQEGSVPRFGPSPEELERVPLFEQVRLRLEAEARDSYLRGFTKALEGVERFDLRYHDLRALAERNWDVAWMPYRHSSITSSINAPGADEFLEYGLAFEETTDHTDEFASSPAFVEGRTAAFRLLLASLGGVPGPVRDNGRKQHDSANAENAG